MHTKTNATSETPPPPESGPRLRAEIPDTVRDGLHDLLLAASQGDRRAIGAIAIAFLPNLVATAQREVERVTVDSDPSAGAEIVAALLEALASGALATSPPAPGEGLAWLERTVRRFAKGRAPFVPS
jgi:hypothetical protein